MCNILFLGIGNTRANETDGNVFPWRICILVGRNEQLKYDKIVNMKIKLKDNVLGIRSAYCFYRGPDSTTIQSCSWSIKTAKTTCKQKSVWQSELNLNIIFSILWNILLFLKKHIKNVKTFHSSWIIKKQMFKIDL